MVRSHDVGPTARALLALDVLQAQPGITAADLGDHLGVTDRAARRYVAILRDAGIPIESTPGRYGGYAVGRGLRLAPLRFDAVEAVGLVMAVLDGHPAARDPLDVVGRALGRIIRALPASIAEQAELIRDRAAAVPDRWGARPDPAIATALLEAGVDRRRVRLAYTGLSGRAWHGEVDPWAVVIRHGRWYLLCWAHEVGAQRAYRVDRVTAVEPLTTTFDPPPLTDPVATLEDHLARGWAHDVVVEIDATVDQARPWLASRMGRLEALADGRCRLDGSTNSPAEYVAALAALPHPFRIEGDEFRAAAAALADRLRAAAG